MNNNSRSYGLVLVTAASEQEAKTIAEGLIKARLAACVTILPVHSVYRWEGKINSEREWQLMIKTDLNYFEQLTVTIKELHSYTLPEIIALDIVAGSPAYLNWLGENIQSVP